VHLGLDHSLWNGIHGIIKPTFQAFGKVANGLSQGTSKTKRQNQQWLVNDTENLKR